MLRGVVGRGWATVELDRAVRELAGLLADGMVFEEAPRSTLLGARSLRGRADPGYPGGPAWIVILEPDTEGRLAGFLARHGEDWAATWVGGTPPDPPSRTTSGPLGDEWLASGDPTTGPFMLRLAAATIDP